MGLFRPLSRSATAALVAVVAVGVGGAVVAATHTGSTTDRGNVSSPTDGPAVVAGVHVVGLHHGKVAWDQRLKVVSTNAALDRVSVVRRGGEIVDGSMNADGTRWTSSSGLVPLSRYRAIVVLADDSKPHVVRFRSTDTKKHLTALLSPGDSDTVGVGSPVIVRLSRPVTEKQRAEVESRLAVSTTPSVIGAWHWMSSQELHWRPPTYWKPHTAVTVSSHLEGLDLGHGVWGTGDHTSTFRIGDSHISRVDAARHQMYVYENRKLIRTFPISAGNDTYPTKSGVHITFEKSQVVTMDSATVGIPRNSPDGYYEKVYWDVRISYGGAFVHAAPWSIAAQGVVNVSHGCVNVAPANAEWFYNWSLRGDVVDVYNTLAAPDTADPGMADWNMSWKQWVAGDAAPTGAAKHLHPPLPHDAEPAAPGASAPHSASSSPSPSPRPSSSSPSPSPSPRHRRHG